ncbi:uncharacterized protein TRIADDRAFT_54571 [Trichoplax adhaerens]|uniref:Repulsive guidance molecule C-terminal domain-containing protein n=1 Tax=Trichoplax adhaerens TaxID=10228 RepID=B3RSE7_TRIAD|nr:hypothetical protein TRIADDRAFT_54571 [Trichoplax adhaerens]EDV27043.1 hypothetical protein TRIADDRAFT_54571 [Trichoplax adhaerens]|eukprot:XP_002111039.1 hypothetical protein TRIADDRAFT_54571 [Trichoplax adhaerens]
MCAFVHCLHNAYTDGCQCNLHLKQFYATYQKFQPQCHNNSSATPTFLPTQPNRVTTSVDYKCRPSYDDALQYKTCSIFGSWHLRTFDGGLQSCTSSISRSQSGSWPVVKNKHFMVQGSFHTANQYTTALRMNKVSVVIKEEDCTSPRIYKASIDNIPSVFTNGSPKGKGIRVEVLKEKVKMKIVIERINTSIIVHQTGPFLAIIITVPSSIEYTLTDNDNLPVICERGCPKVYGNDFDEPTKDWSSMYGGSAYNNCSLSNFTNYYLYTCTVDLITSDNITALMWTTSAMEDFYESNGGPTQNETIAQFFTTPATDNVALKLSKSSLVVFISCVLCMLLIM